MLRRFTKSIRLKTVRYKDWTENKGKAAIVERKLQTFRKSGGRKLKITLGKKLEKLPVLEVNYEDV